uniref:Uncharacterized protein n=1 Tax=Myotis myotis TaxID=51298 RepID=A0A7J7WHV6_MYOMY|nr:hypothetical protein mMyoMyo1_012029 [Myotis myotis]
MIFMPVLQWTPARTHYVRWKLKSTVSLERRVVSWLTINPRKVHRNFTQKELFQRPALGSQHGWRARLRVPPPDTTPSSLRGGGWTDKVRREGERGQSSEEGEPRGRRTAPTLRTRTGETPHSPGGWDPARPLPSGASRRLGCPRRTGRRDLRGPGSARVWRAPPRPRAVGKGKCGSRTEGYSQEWPGALRLRPRPLREKLLRRRQTPSSS